MGKLPPPDLWKIKELKLLPKVKIPSRERPSRCIGPASIKLSWRPFEDVGAQLHHSGGDLSPQGTKPTAARRCICASSIAALSKQARNGLLANKALI